MVANKIKNMVKTCQKQATKNLKALQLENNLIFQIDNKLIFGIIILINSTRSKTLLIILSFCNKCKRSEIIFIDNNT